MVITAVHEAGHFYIAKLFKVKILDFSIGMGKSIKVGLAKTILLTIYAYCLLADM